VPSSKVMPKHSRPIITGETPVTRQGRPVSSNSVSPTSSPPMVVQPSTVGMAVSSASGPPTCAPFMNTTRRAGCAGDSASITSRR